MVTFSRNAIWQLSSREDAGSPAVSAHCPADLEAVPAAEWDRLIGRANTPLRYGLLRAWEHSQLSGLRSRPVVATVPGRPGLSGASPGYFYDLDLLTVRWPRLAELVRVPRRRWPRLAITRAYEVGTPLPLANPFLVEQSTDQQAIIRALICQALEEARSGRAAFVLVQNFTGRTGPVADELRSHGLVPVRIPPTAVMELSYSTFDEYLGAMRAQYRRRANKALERTRDLSVEHLHEFGDLAEEMARLWRAIYERAREVRREILTPEFFRDASDVEETSALLVRRRDGSIAAFALLLSDGPTLSFMQCGFEERSGRVEGSYFRLLYEIVRLGIDQGYRLVDLGITTLAPKLDVGAVPVPLYAWIKCRNPLVQRVLSAVANSPLQDPGPPEPRRVFKQSPRAAADILAALGD